MKTFKRMCVLSFLFCTLSLGIKAQTLVVWQKSGAKVTFQMDSQPKTLFSDNQLVIKTNTTEVSYPRESIIRYTYENLASGIDDAKQDGIDYDASQSKLSFAQLKAGEKVEIYSTDGSLMKSVKADKEGKLTVSLSELTKGVYVVKSSSSNFKILKQ